MGGREKPQREARKPTNPVDRAHRNAKHREGQGGENRPTKGGLSHHLETLSYKEQRKEYARENQNTPPQPLLHRRRASVGMWEAAAELELRLVT